MVRRDRSARRRGRGHARRAAYTAAMLAVDTVVHAKDAIIRDATDILRAGIAVVAVGAVETDVPAGEPATKLGLTEIRRAGIAVVAGRRVLAAGRHIRPELMQYVAAFAGAGQAWILRIVQEAHAPRRKLEPRWRHAGFPVSAFRRRGTALHTQTLLTRLAGGASGIVRTVAVPIGSIVGAADLVC